MFRMGRAPIDIIQAEGLPSGKSSIFIMIRVNAAICSAARAFQPDMRIPASASGFWGR
jgi:hypothetical protein